ncbi:MAG: peptidoglycan-binding domain-containing protein [Armatimonadetes bacterium]|nr:peptidoglycan-binding domain-containing protein [Armatimonadota bacterium]
MSNYGLGSQGAEVNRIQTRLKQLGNYAGRVDGIYAVSTETAVKAFQTAHSIGVTGVVGPQTWGALFPGETMPPPIVDHPLIYRCLALTGSYETDSPIPDCFAGLSGDFDGQGISFGVLQWNFGQGSLPPLLIEMDTKHSNTLRNVFGSNYTTFQSIIRASKTQQMAWARSIQIKNRLNEPWRSQFKALGATDDVSRIRRVHRAGSRFDVRYCHAEWLYQCRNQKSYQHRLHSHPRIWYTRDKGGCPASHHSKPPC